MKSLSEYTNTTSAVDLYAYLTELIVDGHITHFPALMEFTASLPKDARYKAVMPRLFKLIRKLYWGFFKDVDHESFPKVWKEVVISDPTFKTCGALKRNLTISDIYVGILDLHGYTRFCEKNKNNLSMLQMLDDMIQVDVVNLARENNVVLQRRQGDEMVMVGASACDVLALTLMILEYFSKKRNFNIQANSTQRSGYKIILEEMHISAGIAGGKKFTPFIITRDGDLSGGVVNTAARLQGRANELSINFSKVLITKTVYSSIQNELKTKSHPFFASNSVEYFDSGWISFKGISVAIHEVLYSEEDKLKSKYEVQMNALYKAVEGKLWKDGIFEALLNLLLRVYRFMPEFKMDIVDTGRTISIKNEDFCRLAQTALNKFRSEQDYNGALEDLELLISRSRRIQRFDRLCLEYAQFILDAYKQFSEDYRIRLLIKIDEKAPIVLPPKYKSLYEDGKKGHGAYEKLQEHLIKTLSPLEVSLLWSSAVDETQDKLNVSIYSGKK